nr:HmuY family protein [uncultured Fluviicola sp.]
MKKVFVITLIPILGACFKKEIPVQKPVTGATTMQIELGGNYANQIYYDLETNSILRQNNREVWDLAFEAGENGFHILLNESRIMAAALSDETDITALTSDAGLTYTWDFHTGNLDSTAIGDWQSLGKVYAIDLGTGLSGTNLGKKKLKVVSVNSTEYQIQFADLSSSTIQSFTVPKSTTAGFTYFSMTGSGALKDIEPNKETWDLVFTAYCHVFDSHTPYSVVGVLSNRYGVKVQEVSVPFAELKHSDIVESAFENRINVIGYDWKTYNFDNGTYVVNSNRTFVVKTVLGRYYKLRFVDYYDVNGVKGAPKFELQELIP